MIFVEFPKGSFFASPVVYFASGISSNPAPGPPKYTTGDAKNEPFDISSNLIISLLETFIILEEYEGLGTKRIPGSSGLRCVPKPSYSSRIMKVSSKENYEI